MVDAYLAVPGCGCDGDGFVAGVVVAEDFYDEFGVVAAGGCQSVGEGVEAGQGAGHGAHEEIAVCVGDGGQGWRVVRRDEVGRKGWTWYIW